VIEMEGITVDPDPQPAPLRSSAPTPIPTFSLKGEGAFPSCLTVAEGDKVEVETKIWHRADELVNRQGVRFPVSGFGRRSRPEPYPSVPHKPVAVHESREQVFLDKCTTSDSDRP